VVPDTPNSVLLAPIGVLYIIYLCYSCCTDTQKYLMNVTILDSTIYNIKQALLAPPVVKCMIQCYHYEKTKKGKRRRVNTHYAEDVFPFNQWTDKSPPVEAMQHIDVFLLTRLFTHINIRFSTPASASLSIFKRVFIRLNDKDDHYDFTISEEIQHHKQYNLVHNPARGGQPWYSNPGLVAFMDFLVLGWIAKSLLDKNSTKVEYTIEKYIISSLYGEPKPEDEEKEGGEEIGEET
jgi:hypothetical protein